MSTMWGADAEALEALAAQVRSSGRSLDGSQARLGRSIHGSPWSGPSAERFRQQWDAEYRRSMRAASSFLDDAGAALEHHADEQRTASTTDGAGGPAGIATRDLIDALAAIPGLDALLDQLRGLFPGEGGAEAILGVLWDELGPHVTGAKFFTGLGIGLVSEAIRSRLVFVDGYTKATGKVVADYVRYRPGEAAAMRRFFGDAKNLARVAKYLGPTVDGVWSAVGQWREDAGLPGGERVVRAGAVGAFNFTAALGAGAAGAAIGGPVGFVVGVGVGVGFSYVNERWDLDGKVADGASWVYDQAGDAASAAVDWGSDRIDDVAEVGGDVVDGGKKIISGGADLAKRGFSAANPFD